MTASDTAALPRFRLGADAVLKGSAVVWFAIALIGQWAFAYYIAVFYGRRALAGDWAAWSDRMLNGFLPGDLLGNAAVVLHIVLAFLVSFCGPLQFIPAIRRRAASFHRWNGRVYLVAGTLISLGALYMVWTRGALDGRVGGPNAIGISLNGVLIVVFAALTVRFAMARRIDVHQRWALRLFMVMSGVWFMRVGYGLWSFLHAPNRPPGVGPRLDGWFDIALPWLAWMIPLAALEIYMRARDGGSAGVKYATALLVVVLAVGTAIGVASFGSRLVEHVT